MSEHTEQVALCDWLNRVHPDILFWSTPNGAHLAGDAGVRAAKMNALKSEGFLPGVADIFIAEPRGGYHGLFIEMKDKDRGELSENQEWFLAEVARRGYLDYMCHGFEVAQAVIEDYLSLPVVDITQRVKVIERGIYAVNARELWK